MFLLCQKCGNGEDVVNMPLKGGAFNIFNPKVDLSDKSFWEIVRDDDFLRGCEFECAKCGATGDDIQAMNWPPRGWKKTTEQ